MTKVTPPPPTNNGQARPTRVIGCAIRRGSERITLLVAPALRVVREPGKPPRVEFHTPGLAS